MSQAPWNTLPNEIKLMIATYAYTPQPKTVRAIHSAHLDAWTYRTSMPPNRIPAAFARPIRRLFPDIMHLIPNFKDAPRLNPTEQPYKYFNYELDTLSFEDLECCPKKTDLFSSRFMKATAILLPSITVCRELRSLQMSICLLYFSMYFVQTVFQIMTGLRKVTLIAHDHYNVHGIGFNERRHAEDMERLERQIARSTSAHYELTIKWVPGPTPLKVWSQYTIPRL